MKEIDMTKGKPLSVIVRFAIPLMLGDLFQQLYNATDSAMIGQYAGDVALAAVSSSFFLIRLVIGLFIGFSAGATVIIAQFIAALLVFLQLIYSKEIYGVNVRSIRIEKKLVPEILSMGLPSGLQSMIVALSNVMVQSYINLEGKNMMAGFGIFNKIDGVIMLPLSAIALALTTYTAQNYGAKNQERIKQGIKAMLFLQAISWVIGSVICILFGRGICELFSKEAQVIDAAMLTMRYLIPLYWAMGVGYSMTCILRGVGKSKEASILFILAMCVERQIWILLLKKFDFGIGAVLSSYPFSWAMTIVGSGLYVVYLKKKENIFA